jgi:hypothetical protein
MSAFQPAHVRRTHTLAVDAPIDDAFPLFTPAGEKLWVPGWDPVFLHPRSGETCVGMVFTTGSGDDATYWSTVAYDPARHLARYARVTPASRFGFVDVACTAQGPRRTRVQVSYVYTALTAAGNAFIDAFTQVSYEQMIGEWQPLIEAYLARAG